MLVKFEDPFDRLFRVFDDKQDDPYLVFEDKDAWIYEIDMPGVEKESLQVQLVGRELTIKGVREQRGSPRKIELKLSVPAGAKREAVKAALNLGVLRLEVPKAVPTSLQIQVE